MKFDLNRLKAAVAFGRTCQDPVINDCSEIMAQAADEIDRLKEENLRLHAVRDAAEPFMADPPVGVGDHVPCQQYTTAGDCRALATAMQRVEEKP